MPKTRIGLLLIASYYFYVSNNHWLIILILLSTQVDYVAGKAIEDTSSKSRKKLYLIISIICNLGILFYFKYCNFFISSIVDTASFFNVRLSWVDLNIVLPVGISFYTFQSMSYTIDVYRGVLKAERSWLKFSFFVAFFPQLIAGPIVRASDFIPQIQKRPQLNSIAFEKSIQLIMQGLIKKIILADILANYADFAFNTPTECSALQAWLGVYAFSFQIYFDFSGYTDIAIGSSRLLGYKLPDNFRRPYMAVSFSDFWKRWHISLSSWLRDYLYIPLGGNRGKHPWSSYRNLMLTMLLGGLWHGAAAHFVLWGFMHGIFLSIERFLGYKRKSTDVKFFSKSSILRRLILFNFITFTWLVFRCENLGKMQELLSSMFNFDSQIYITNGMLIVALVIIASWSIQLIGEAWNYKRFFFTLPTFIKATAYSIIAIGIIMFNSAIAKPFIYFKF